MEWNSDNPAMGETLRDQIITIYRDQFPLGFMLSIVSATDLSTELML